MSKIEKSSKEEIEKLLNDLPEAEWVSKMRAYYIETGTYRGEDLKRLLGDQNCTVTMSGIDSMLNSLISKNS
jgi:hypothetical protein